MKELNIEIESFFKRENFTPNELQYFRNSIKDKCKTKSEKKLCTSTIRNSISSYSKVKIDTDKGKKIKYIYLKKGSKIIPKKIEKKELVNDFFENNINLTNSQLAERLQIKYKEYCKILKKHQIMSFEEGNIVSKDQLEKLNRYITSRIMTIERKKKFALRKIYEKELKAKRKKKVNKVSNLSGVYRKIKENGGIGKLIYNAMRK
jgi:hypothetical protein